MTHPYSSSFWTVARVPSDVRLPPSPLPPSHPRRVLCSTPCLLDADLALRCHDRFASAGAKKAAAVRKTVSLGDDGSWKKEGAMQSTVMWGIMAFDEQVGGGWLDE